MSHPMRTALGLMSVVALLIVAGVRAQNGSGPLSQPEFEKLHKELQPAPAEAWTSIPWRASLLEAQAVAAREQKPLFIWAMDGNPLGCG